MLYIIGLGLDKNDISLKGMAALKKCKKVYLESYTSDFICPVKELEKVIKRKVIIANREMIEEDNDIILKQAKKGNAALLVLGDPLSATTHIDIVLRCTKRKIKFEVIHAVSVFNAISETGLQLYKFGKTASIPRWEKSYKPESFYDIIEDNLGVKAHTLLLIDIGLSVNEALMQLKEASKKRSSKLGNIIICERLGTSQAKISFGDIDMLIKKKFKVPACVIVPAELHFMEEAALKKF